jgi:hypothetical protein
MRLARIARSVEGALALARRSELSWPTKEK